MSSYTTLTCVVYNECEIIIVFSHCGDSECRGRKKIPRPCACGARLSEYLVLSSYKLPWSAEISSVCDRSNGRKEPTSQRVQPLREPLPGKNGNLICFFFQANVSARRARSSSHAGIFHAPPVCRLAFDLFYGRLFYFCSHARALLGQQIPDW